MNRAELEKRAAQLGIKPGSLRMRLHREKERERARSADHTKDFESFGLRLTTSFHGELKAVRGKLELVAQRVGLARVDAERLLRSKLPAPVKQLENLVGLCLSLEQRVADALPRSLCPYCKGLDRLQDDCRSCHGTGLASVQQFNAAPRRLKEAPHVVMVDGKEVPLSDFEAPPKPDPFEG